MIGAIITGKKVVKDQDTGVLTRIELNVTTARGERDPHHPDGAIAYDNPYILSDRPEIMEEVATWNDYDIVLIKGVFATKQHPKRSFCEFCSQPNVANGTISYVYPIYAKKLKSCLSKEEALGYVAAMREVSNQYYCFATLLRDPRIKVITQGLKVMQAPIELKRKFYVTSDPPEIKRDTPFIKIYGDAAEYNAMRLRQSSIVYIDGFLQTRNVNRKSQCCACENTYSWFERIQEIVPYKNGIEYINGTLTDEEVKKLEEEKKDELLKRAGLGRWVTANINSTNSATETSQKELSEIEAFFSKE